MLFNHEGKPLLAHIGAGILCAQCLQLLQVVDFNVVYGGEGGIRTLGRALRPYDGLANRCFRPLSHLSARN